MVTENSYPADIDTCGDIWPAYSHPFFLKTTPLSFMNSTDAY